VPLTSEEAAAIAAGIGSARGLRPGQLPSGALFAEGLNGMEECAGFLESTGRQGPPFPLPRFVPVPVVEPTVGGNGG
jgi:hypothetical protein